MIIQIYNTHTPEEGIALAKAGANHIGMVLSASGLPGEINQETAKRIVETVGQPGNQSCTYSRYGYKRYREYGEIRQAGYSAPQWGY